MRYRRSCVLWTTAATVALSSGACDGAPQSASRTAGDRTTSAGSPVATARDPAAAEAHPSVGWSLGDGEIHDDKVDFGIHVIDVEWDYVGVVFSVSPNMGVGYTGSLWPSEDVAVVDSDGNRLAALVWQNWTLYGNTTIGSVSFEPISDTVGAATLVVSHFEREDGGRTSGPWELEFLRMDGFDPALPRYVHGSVVNQSPVAHSEESVVYVGNGLWEYDPETITPTPEGTQEAVEATPERVGTPGPTTLPMQTLEFAPNAPSPFTLRAWSREPVPVRQTHAAMDPTAGTYWYRFVDGPAQ